MRQNFYDKQENRFQSHESVVLVKPKHPNPSCADCAHSEEDTNNYLYCALKVKQVRTYNKCEFFVPEGHTK